MAWIRRPGEETEEQPIASGQGVGTLGISGAGSTGQSAPQRGTGFSDLQKYIEANKGAAAGLGENVASKLAKEGQDVTTAQQTAESGLESSLQPIESFNAEQLAKSAVSPFEKSISPSANVLPRRIAGVNGMINAARIRPNSSLTSSQQTIKDVYGKGGQYEGPQSVDYGTAKTEASEAENLAKGADTEAGRFSMLRDLTKGRPVKTGNINLDQAILQSSPEAMQKVSESASQLKGLSDKIGQAETANTERIGKAKEKSASDWQTINKTLSPTMANLNSAITSEEALIADLTNKINNPSKSTTNNVVANVNKTIAEQKQQLALAKQRLQEYKSRQQSLKNIMGY